MYPGTACDVAPTSRGQGSTVAPVVQQNGQVSPLRSTLQCRLQGARARPLALVQLMGTSRAKLGDGLVVARDDDRAAGLGVRHRCRQTCLQVLN